MQATSSHNLSLCLSLSYLPLHPWLPLRLCPSLHHPHAHSVKALAPHCPLLAQVSQARCCSMCTCAATPVPVPTSSMPVHLLSNATPWRRSLHLVRACAPHLQCHPCTSSVPAHLISYALPEQTPAPAPRLCLCTSSSMPCPDKHRPLHPSCAWAPHLQCLARTNTIPCLRRSLVRRCCQAQRCWSWPPQRGLPALSPPPPLAPPLRHRRAAGAAGAAVVVPQPQGTTWRWAELAWARRLLCPHLGQPPGHATHVSWCSLWGGCLRSWAHPPPPAPPPCSTCTAALRTWQLPLLSPP